MCVFSFSSKDGSVEKENNICTYLKNTNLIWFYIKDTQHSKL